MKVISALSPQDLEYEFLNTIDKRNRITSYINEHLLRYREILLTGHPIFIDCTHLDNEGLDYALRHFSWHWHTQEVENTGGRGYNLMIRKMTPDEHRENNQ